MPIIILLSFQIAEGFGLVWYVVRGIKMAASLGSLSVLFGGVGAQIHMTLAPSPTPAPWSSPNGQGPKAWFELMQDVDLQAGYVLILSLILSLIL